MNPMKAVRFHEHGGPEVLKYEDAPEPTPKPGEVLLQVKAASLNPLDVWIRKGIPGWKTSMPHIPGADAAGIVVGTNQRVVIDPAVSCRVCHACTGGEQSMCPKYSIFGEHEDGTHAELFAVPADGLLPIPDSMSFETAAAAPLTFLTAWTMLIKRGRLKAGEDVLILGAGGGVGTACVQIARLAGARVIAAVGSDAKAARAKEIGAHLTINYAKDDFSKVVRDMTKKRGVDVVVDHVGKETWARSLASARRGGRILTCGATTGHDPTEDLRQIFYRQLEIIGSTMGSRREFLEVMKLVLAGDLKPVVDRALPLKDAAEAHRLLEGRQVFGKLVLTP